MLEASDGYTKYMMKEIVIKIDDKKPYTGEADTHPEGDFYCNGVKYTCWKDTLFETFNVGDEAKIDYTEKENEFNGRTFTNRNISKMAHVETQVHEEPKQLKDAVYEGSPHSELKAGEVIIQGVTYEVILRRMDG